MSREAGIGPKSRWQRGRSAILLVALLALVGSCQAEATEVTTTHACPDPTVCGDGYVVAASAIGDGTYAYNLVIDGEPAKEALRAISADFREAVGEGRLLIYFFETGAGDEVDGFGVLPGSDSDPAPEPLDSASYVGMIELMRSGETAERWTSRAG